MGRFFIHEIVHTKNRLKAKDARTRAAAYTIRWAITQWLEAATAQADYVHVHGELQRDGVTLLVLWEEYRDQAVARDLVPKSHTTFCRGHRAHFASHNVTNRLEHKPGQVMDAAHMQPAPGQAYPIFAQAPVQGRDVSFSTRYQHNSLPPPSAPTTRDKEPVPPSAGVVRDRRESQGHGKASKTSYCPTYRIVLL